MIRGLVGLVGLIITAFAFYFLIGAILAYAPLDGLYKAVMGFGALGVGWNVLKVGLDAPSHE